MAKSKVTKASRMGSLLASAKKSHQHDVGAGGSIYDPYLSHVRGMRLPGLGLMNMLGFTALRDSCTVLIDGKPGSSKSSLAVEMFNWGAPYAVGGAIYDCENKAAFDIALGTMSETSLWLPGHVVMASCRSLEVVQAAVKSQVARCRDMNEGIDREEQIPFIIVTDPLSGAPSEETMKVIAKEGHGSRGHGGRVEALQWSIWLKDHEADIANLPIISVFVNHTKERTQKAGQVTYKENYNPGGISQNYATTLHFHCSGGKKMTSESVTGNSYQDIRIKCAKNSRGPTGKSTTVRKYSRLREDGITLFWWDWDRNSAEFLAETSGSHPVREVLKVTKKTNEKYSCKELGMVDESPSKIGAAVMADSTLVGQIVEACRFFQIKEFNVLSEEEAAELYTIAHEAHMAHLKDTGRALPATVATQEEPDSGDVQG